MATAILLLRRIRSRTKLIYVGTFTGLVVFLTTIGVGTLADQPFGTSEIALKPTNWPLLIIDPSCRSLLGGAMWLGFCSLLAGLLMTGLLPFIESLFDVQTDISLLELGDVTHPLLQELVRRAPGTHNHSITVASIAEAAAEAIGANGLLVRVGAYFHDIGKMLKPHYFVENQGHDGNRHEPRAGDEHADHHRPRQGRRRPGPPAPPARADHRPDRAAPRHDAGRVLLPPEAKRREGRPRRAARSTKARSAIPAPSRRPRRPAS